MSSYGKLGAYSGKSVLPLQASFGGNSAEHFVNYEQRPSNSETGYASNGGYNGPTEDFSRYITLRGYSGRNVEHYNREYAGASGINGFKNLGSYNKEYFDNAEEPEFYEEMPEIPEYFEEPIAVMEAMENPVAEFFEAAVNEVAPIATAMPPAAAEAAAVGVKSALVNVAGGDAPNAAIEKAKNGLAAHPQARAAHAALNHLQNAVKKNHSRKMPHCACKQGYHSQCVLNRPHPPSVAKKEFFKFGDALNLMTGGASGAIGALVKKKKQKGGRGVIKRYGRGGQRKRRGPPPSKGAIQAAMAANPAVAAAVSDPTVAAAVDESAAVAEAVVANPADAQAIAAEYFENEYFDEPEYFEEAKEFDLPENYVSNTNLGFYGQQPSLFPGPQPAKISNGPYVVPAYSTSVKLNYSRN